MRLQVSLPLDQASQIVDETLRLGRAEDLLPLTVVVLDAGGLERRLRVLRLPVMNTQKSLFESVPVDVSENGDNPLWVCVTTEDGFQAWSSPIFVFRG